jgi:Arc/MetJ-type ribon-helix-helix transcriptional regulator
MKNRIDMIRAAHRKLSRKNSKAAKSAAQITAELDVDRLLPVSQDEINEEVVEMTRYNADAFINTEEL